jgi:hypothetical protein
MNREKSIFTREKKDLFLRKISKKKALWESIPELSK